MSEPSDSSSVLPMAPGQMACQRWSRLTPGQRDALFAVVLAAAVVVEVLAVADLVGPAAAVLAQSLVLAAATAARRVAPLAAVIVGGLAGAANPLIYSGGDFDFLLTQIWCVILLAYSVAAHAQPWTRAVGGFLLLLVTFWFDDVRQGSAVTDYAASLVSVAAPWLAGWAVRRARLQAHQLAVANQQLAQQRQAVERSAAEAERLRIARELHDIVAHSLTVVALQADAADALLPDRPEAAQRAVVSIRVTAQESLQEMRRLLGTLRPSERSEPEGPARGLADVALLAGEAGSDGAHVALSVLGQRASVPPVVDQAAYRILQEGLTNARRHGDGDRCSVSVRYTPDAVEVDVWNTRSPRASPDPGFGLVGVRERVRALGGQVTAGPDAQGGWALRARLPLHGTPNR